MAHNVTILIYHKLYYKTTNKPTRLFTMADVRNSALRSRNLLNFNMLVTHSDDVTIEAHTLPTLAFVPASAKERRRLRKKEAPVPISGDAGHSAIGACARAKSSAFLKATRRRRITRRCFMTMKEEGDKYRLSKRRRR
jgi:hypothetical protein